MAKSFALALRIVAQIRNQSAVMHWLSQNGRSVREVTGSAVRVTLSSVGIRIHLDNGKKVNWVLASAQADRVVAMMNS